MDFRHGLPAEALEIHKNLALLHGIVEQCREYFRLTFTNLSSEKYDRAEDNLRLSYENYAERARIIVNQTMALPSKGGA